MKETKNAPGGWRASITGTVTVEVDSFRTRHALLVAIVSTLIKEWRRDASQFEGPNAQAFMYQRSTIQLDAATTAALEDWVEDYAEVVTSPVVATRHGSDQ
jgi:hypothetical protein